MKIIISTALWGCLLGFQVLFAQEVKSSIKPIPLDKAVLSGQGLKQVPLKHEPERTFFQRNLYRGKDLSVYVVSSQSWKGKMDNFSIDEYVFILNGKARSKPENGSDRYFHTGEHFAIPKGYTGEWEIMAGDQYHYELSVITTSRAPEAIVSKKLLPAPLDKDKLSGVGIKLDEEGLYSETLFKGDELHMILHGQTPREEAVTEPSKERLIAVLSGQINLEDSKGETYIFYTGDYFLIPAGFTGAWESQGHGLVKYLSIEKS